MPPLPPDRARPPAARRPRYSPACLPAPAPEWAVIMLPTRKSGDRNDHLGLLSDRTSLPNCPFCLSKKAPFIMVDRSIQRPDAPDDDGDEPTMLPFVRSFGSLGFCGRNRRDASWKRVMMKRIGAISASRRTRSAAAATRGSFH